MSNFKEVFQTRLRVLMAEKNMNAEQLSRESGVYVDSIRKYLKGDTAPLFETAYSLAEALGCTPNDLCAFPSEETIVRK